MEQTASIVVGVDGSREAEAALRFAIDEARLRSARVRAVAAWDVPAMAYTAAGYPVWPDLLAQIAEATQTMLDRQVEEAMANGQEVQTERVVREGDPAKVLLDESRDALLLVVGSRGLGGFASLLLGSVSQAVATHASCPVTIVRKRTPPA
jgi:nucleotide-binding universal stress UspA family protein